MPAGEQAEQVCAVERIARVEAQGLLLCSDCCEEFPSHHGEIRNILRHQRPLTANEKLATALAEQAHQAALRGDYTSAIQKLDEAERIAPRFAMIAHYRSNIAYLQGDRAGAIKALKRAALLEPENPLFRTNLERLEAAGSSSSDAKAD